MFNKKLLPHRKCAASPQKDEFYREINGSILSFWESHETKAMRGQNSDSVLKEVLYSYHIVITALSMAEVTCSGVDGRRSSSIVSACYHHHHLLNGSSTRPVYNPAENKTPFFENKAVRGETGALLICCRGPQACRCLYTVYEVCYSRTGRSLKKSKQIQDQKYRME